MKSTSLQKSIQKTHLKVIKNTTKSKKRVINRIYINTLIPGFSYVNNLGISIVPKKCALL